MYSTVIYFNLLTIPCFQSSGSGEPTKDVISTKKCSISPCDAFVARAHNHHRAYGATKHARTAHWNQSFAA